MVHCYAFQRFLLVPKHSVTLAEDKTCIFLAYQGNNFISKGGRAAVTVHQTKSLEQTKKSMAEQIWLNYYNQTLFENGLITEAERNRMKNMIIALMPPAAK